MGLSRGVMILCVVLVFAGGVEADVSLILNGSFENDGWVDEEQYVTEQPPERWDDVNVPAGKFGGYIGTEWSPHGDYSLTLYSEGEGTFEAGDIAMISQKQIYLTDVNHIMFELKLKTDWGSIDWDPNKFSAVLQIDGNDVWDSDLLGAGGNCEASVDINESMIAEFKDGKAHTLSVGIRANQVQNAPYIYYIARWDFARFDTHGDCNGFDYPEGDFTYDCNINEVDFSMLTEKWLTDYQPYDLHPDGIIDFYDLAILAAFWKCPNCGDGSELLEMDINNDGIVDFEDFAQVAESWAAEEYDDIEKLAEQWLLESWLYGL